MTIIDKAIFDLPYFKYYAILKRKKAGEMKKIILLLLVMLMSGACVNAANWQPLYTIFPNLNLYIDTDSVKQLNDEECYYAVKYSINNEPEQVSYLKSNVRTNYIGVITTTDFIEENYRPNAVFANPHVFMKPLANNSFLNTAHSFVVSMMPGMKIAASGDKSDLPAVSRHTPGRNTLVSYSATFNQDIQSYVATTCELLNSNWNAPSSGYNTQGIAKVTIGADGSLIDCSLLESSGDETTDRSIISAIEKTVPYPKFPSSAGPARSLDFQFVFDKDIVKQAVVY